MTPNARRTLQQRGTVGRPGFERRQPLQSNHDPPNQYPASALLSDYV
jgi:hypothetical protein